MRLLSALFVSVLSATTLAPQIADACGGYVRVDPAPRMLMVSSHGLIGSGNKWAQRTFVVLEKSIEQGKGGWKLLAPGTYDATQIMELPALASPMVFTLIGPSGVRTVKATKQFALARDFHIGFDQQRIALEIDVPAQSQFAIAIPGKLADAKWHDLDYGYGSTSIKGTDLQIVETETLLTVRQKGSDVGYGTGRALGMVQTKGRAFLVLNSKGQISTLELPKPTMTKA